MLVNWGHFDGRLMELRDQASYALQIIEAKSFNAYLGPYSRFEFNHPGPFLFYYHALTEPLMFFVPSPMGKHMFAQFLLNLFLLFLILQIIYRCYESTGLRYLFFICLLMGWLPVTPKVFMSLWPPYVLLIPMVLFTLAAIRFAMGEIRYLPELSVSAVIILHNNLSGSIIVMPLAAIALGFFFYKRKEVPPLSKSKTRFIILFTLIFLVLTSAPPILEELQPGEGNLTKIYNFYQNRGSGNQSLSDAASYLAGLLPDPTLPCRYTVSPTT